MINKDKNKPEEFEDFLVNEVIEERNEIKSKKLLFTNKKIAISISESENLEELGFSKIHQQDTILELTRYLIINGATLLYGGDLRSEGYTFLFSEIVKQYTPHKDNKKYYENYFSFPIYLNIQEKQNLDFIKNGVKVNKVSPPEELNLNNNEFYPPIGNDNLFIWSECLTKMRNQMNDDNHARIFMGGRKSNFKGKYPGLLEEVLLSLESDKPTYLIGAFGGITKSIIDAINNKKPEELSDEWQKNQNSEYSKFVDFYNSKENILKIDYNESLKFINTYSLKKLSKNNGLSESENQRLFETIHLHEIIYLVLKGLKITLN